MSFRKLGRDRLVCGKGTTQDEEQTRDIFAAKVTTRGNLLIKLSCYKFETTLNRFGFVQLETEITSIQESTTCKKHLLI